MQTAWVSIKEEDIRTIKLAFIKECAKIDVIVNKDKTKCTIQSKISPISSLLRI